MEFNDDYLENLSDEDLMNMLQKAKAVSSLPYVATPKQMEFHMASERGLDRPVLYGGAIGGGKTYSLCAEAIRECIDIPGNRVLLARKTNVTFKSTTLVTLLRLVPQGVEHRKVEQRFLFPNGSEILYMGLGEERDNEKLRGLEIGMLGIDEASEIDKPTFQIAASRCRWGPAMKANRIKVRLTSNPAQGWLKEDFVDNPKPLTDENGTPLLDSNGNEIPAFRYIRATMKDNPYIDPSYAREAEELFGDSPTWKAAFIDGDWDAFTSADQVLPSHLISDAMKRDIAVDPNEPIIWGVDIARFGDDRTTLFENQGGKFTVLQTWKKQAIDVTANEIIGWYRSTERKPSIINLDDIGVGGGVVDICISAGLPARGVNVQRASKHNKHKFTNMKAELWWGLRKLLEAQPVSIPDMPELKAELNSVRFQYTTGRITIPEKAEIKKQLGRSPDLADGLVLASWTGYQSYVVGEEIASAQPTDTRPKTLDDITRESTLTKLTGLLRRSSF